MKTSQGHVSEMWYELSRVVQQGRGKKSDSQGAQKLLKGNLV